ncbi:MAG: hypothetical protein ACK5KO_04960 [Arachnia sp.]
MIVSLAAVGLIRMSTPEFANVDFRVNPDANGAVETDSYTVELLRAEAGTTVTSEHGESLTTAECFVVVTIAAMAHGGPSYPEVILHTRDGLSYHPLDVYSFPTTSGLNVGERVEMDLMFVIPVDQLEGSEVSFDPGTAGSISPVRPEAWFTPGLSDIAADPILVALPRIGPAR